MEKRATHAEWGRLRMAGRPLITSTTTGATPLLWVACRASFCLIHIYCDAQLKVIWRFPSDPIFINLEKSRYRWTGKGRKMTIFDANVPCLLVVTIDGYVWFLPDCVEDVVPERPLKRMRESCPTEAKKAVSRSSKDEWGLFEDIDVYESMDCEDSMPVSGVNDGSSNNPVQDNPETSTNVASKQISTSKSVKVCLQMKQLSVSSSANVLQKIRPQLVMQEHLIGCVQQACFACFGPQDTVIVISVRGIELFQASPTVGNSSVVFKRLKFINGDITFRSQPTCALVVTSANHVSSGNTDVIVSLHEKLFDAFSDGLSCEKPPHLLLKGDTDGLVYLSPLFCPELDMSSSRILCNLGQPVLALLAISAENATAVKSEIRDTLIVIGQYGHIVAISCTNKLESDSCILSSSYTKYNTSFEINLDKRNFEIREWKVQAPITSVCLLGSRHLCYCAGLEGFISLLFEERDTPKSFGIISKNMQNQDAKHGIGLKHQTATQSSIYSSEQARCNLREKLFPKKLPLADAVIGVAGKDISVSNMSGRPLVLLTARGQILGVEISNSIPILEACYAGALPKRSWRTWESNMDEHVKRLIDIVDDISRETDHIDQCSHFLNEAISELAISLKLSSSILTDPSRDSMLNPNPLNRKCAGNTVLSPKCTIKVTPQSSILASTRNLAFGSCPDGSEIDCVEKLLQEEISGLARISVTLSNCTIHPLSPHWILVLELQNTGLKNNRADIYSSIINNGFGLAPDSQCIIEFYVKVPGLYAGPVSLFIYLCHLHDYHELLHKQYSTDDEQKNDTRRKHLKGLTCVDDSKIEAFLAKVSLEEVQDPSTASSVPLDAFGSICIPLSQHRIDILSMGSHPPQKFHHLVRASHLSHKSAEQDTHDSIGKTFPDSVLGAFSGTLNFTFKDSEKHLRTAADALSTWSELFFEDLLEKGSLSKAKDKIILSVPGGQIIAISLKCWREQQTDLYFEAPSLLLGCLLREALIWRLKNSEAIGSFQNGKTNLDNLPAVQGLGEKTTVNNKVLEAKRQIEVILHRAEALSTIWDEIKMQNSKSAKALPILADVHSILNDLLKVYRDFRQS